MEVNDVKDVFKNLKGQSIFEGILNKNQQKEYRRQYLCLIEPKPVESGVEVIHFSSKSGFKEKPFINGYAAPFLEVLEQVLNCEDVLFGIDNPLKNEDGRYRTVLDGFVYQSHPVVLQHPFALAIIGYGDDLTPGDTLSAKGSRQGIRSFTWTLGNVYPWLRASLRCIFPIAFCKKEFVNNEDALKDFCDGINKLSSEEGVTFNINGKPRTFHGILLFMVGDTPASANLAGFKESYGAWSPCRQCLVNKSNIFEEFTEVDSLLRNQELHKQHLAAVFPNSDQGEEGEPMEVVFEETEECNPNPSVRYGVNSRSCFLDVQHFDVCTGFPQDIMHVLGEGGVLDVNIRLLISGCLTRKFLLSNVNDNLDSLEYGSFKKDKPAKIKTDHLSNNLRQTASQMFLLCHLIPFALFGKCAEDQLKNFIRLLMIVNICLSPDSTDNCASKLRKLIKVYLNEFKRLYGVEKMTLKFHFLVHLAKQLLMFGPYTQQWAMRFEGFHATLKRLFKILHNSTNLPLSLMERILTRILHAMETSPPGKYLYPGHITRLGSSIQLQYFEWKVAVQAAVPGIKDSDCLQSLELLTFYGHTFKHEDIVPLKSSHHPAFGVIFKMCMFGETPILLCTSLQNVGFEPKLNAYEIKMCTTPSMVAVCLNPAVVVQPLFKVKLKGHWYVILMNNSAVPDEALDEWICT